MKKIMPVAAAVARTEWMKVRGVRLFQRFARWLSQRSVTPNQISVTSVFFAMLTAGCLLIMPHAEGAAVWVLPVLGAVFIQCRLLCNLFDGNGLPAGPFWMRID